MVGCGAAWLRVATVTITLRNVCAGDIVGVGKGCKALKVGDTVVYSKWGIGVTDLEVQGQEYAVLREMDIIGTFPASGAQWLPLPASHLYLFPRPFLLHS